MDIAWSSNIGFGHLIIYYDEKTKKWIADTECMGEEFIKDLFKFCDDKIKCNFVIDD